MCSYCQICKKTFCAEEDLKKHIRDKHTINCYFCQKPFETTSALREHCSSEHILRCDICKEKFLGKTQLKQHIESDHSNSCNWCNEKFGCKSYLENHVKTVHVNHCFMCTTSFNNCNDLNEHVLDKHTFECEFCEYTGNGEEAMYDHILELHAKPDSKSNLFNCQERDFASKDKAQFGLHYKLYHGYNCSSVNGTTTSSQIELRQLKMNFDRLSKMYSEALEENDRVKTEYEIKLIQTNDENAKTKSENISLKEKVDVLFKLGKSYLERFELDTKSSDSSNHVGNMVSDPGENEIQILDSDDKTRSNEQEWTGNNLRGFKRKVQFATSLDRSEGNQKDHPIPSKNNTNSVNSSGEPLQQQNLQYCHYFVNTGQCSYEEKTGTKCKYAHKPAPMCKNGLHCTRTKCMFDHPKKQSNSRNQNPPFLARNSLLPIPNPWNQGNMMNPGHLMNPWLHPSNQMLTFWPPWQQ